MAIALDEFVAPTSAGEQTDPIPLDYLKDPDYASYDVALSVGIQSKDQSTVTTVSRSNFRNMYWNVAQQLTHHAVTGCVMQAGDLLGSGTISGQDTGSYGSMLELSWKGTREVVVGDEVRKFLKDGDTVVMKGFCQREGEGRVGFGECRGTILPAFTDGQLPGDNKPTPSSERYMDIKLYGFWRSSSAWRVRVALAAKGIDYTSIPVNLMEEENKNADYLAKNPLGQVPLLECTDAITKEVVCLAQSIAIIEFLDSVFPTRRSMIPRDHLDRAVAMEMVEAINAGTQPLQNLFVLKDLEEKSDGKINAKEQAKLINEKGLKAFEVLVKRRREKSAGPFCLGTFAPTIVDAVMVPQLDNARRFGVNVDKACPLLVEIDALCSGHAWFQVSHPSVQPDAQQE
jgi:maleylacetoacetate isomerase